MPSSLRDEDHNEKDDAIMQIERAFRASLRGGKYRPALSHGHDHNAPLHKFEHDTKFFVDCGMFFFAFANAGVELSGAGSMSICVLLSLVVGKTLGIVGFSVVASIFGIMLPDGISLKDLFMIGLLASIGLTVALFVSGEAYADPNLQSQAKLGALISGLIGPIAIVVSKIYSFRSFFLPLRPSLSVGVLIFPLHAVTARTHVSG